MIYGRWRTLGNSQRLDRVSFVKCQCECGNVRLVRLHHLKSGASQSCGCLAQERVRTHGQTKTPLYRTWERMLSRCYNPNHKAFKNYGGRGIVVCSRWRNSFDAFAQDMGPQPPGLTLERVDNSQGYAPDNCRWASRLEQNRNTRKNRLLTFAGRTLCVSEWMVVTGIDKKTIEGRLNRGWSVEDALTRRIPAWRGRPARNPNPVKP